MKSNPTMITEYADASKAMYEGLAKEDQQQPGDPVKLAEILVDLVRKEGVAKERAIPFRLPLGLDCFNDVKAKCEEMLRLLEAWKDVIRSTDCDDQSQKR
jgi:hypothetical protein